MKPHSLLLLPKDPELLAADACSGRPSMALLAPSGRWHTFDREDTPEAYTGSRSTVALALAWDGHVMSLGVMRCWLAMHGNITPANLFTLVHATLGGVPDGVARLREMLEDIGDVVGIDEHKRTIE